MGLTPTVISAKPLREAIGGFLERNDQSGLKRYVSGVRAPDLADIEDRLPESGRNILFALLSSPTKSAVLAEAVPETKRSLLQNLSRPEKRELLHHLPIDDLVRLVIAVPDQRELLLEETNSTVAAQVRALLAYPEESAGRLMTEKFVRVNAAMTVTQTLAHLRKIHPETETFTDLYVTDGDDHLEGVLSLRELILAEPHTALGTIMTTDIISIAPTDDQEIAARLLSHYNFLALPVLEQGRIIGIITVDDILDVLYYEFAEDYFRLVGSDAEEMDRRTPLQVARLRLPWLMGTMVIELFAGVVISHFDDVLKEVILLASFMPVISAISGNVGLQAAAIVVRGLDTGHVSLSNWWRTLGKEMAASLLMALVCGLVLGSVGAVWSKHLPFGLVIGGAMTASMFTASTMGTIIPMVSKRLGFDPATSAGPFETAFQDVIGFAVFLWLASLLLPFLK